MTTFPSQHREFFIVLIISVAVTLFFGLMHNRNNPLEDFDDTDENWD